MPRRVTVDTTQAQSFEAVKPGPYQMLVDEITNPEKSKPSTKNPNGLLGVIVYFAFNDPEIARKAGRVQRWYALEGSGAGFFREFWKAATREDIPMDSKIDVDLDLAIQKKVVCTIGNEEYEGRLQNSLERVASAA